MQPHLQRVKVEAVARGDHDLAIENAAVRETRGERVVQFGEISIERLEIAALNVDVASTAEDDRAEPIPLRLVQKRAAWRKLRRQLRKHRLNWGRDRESTLL